MAAVLQLHPDLSPSPQRLVTPDRDLVTSGRLDRPAGGHRQARPRPSRCARRAAVYRRRRFLAAAVGLAVLLTVARAGVALGGSSPVIRTRHPHVLTVVVQPG